VNEVPRRQSTGPFAPRDVVAEMEDVIEVVFEDETEDGVEPGLEIESEAASARRSRGVPDLSILRFLSMAAPRFSAAPSTDRGAKIASGPFRNRNKWDGPARPPRTGENTLHSSQTRQDARMLPFAYRTEAAR
jgi:hypothetical protein